MDGNVKGRVLMYEAVAVTRTSGDLTGEKSILKTITSHTCTTPWCVENLVLSL